MGDLPGLRGKSVRADPGVDAYGKVEQLPLRLLHLYFSKV
jgi:hypothetical protein